MLRTVQHHVAGAFKRGKVVGVKVHVVGIGNVAGAGAERALISGHLGTILTMGADHHPLAKQRVPAKLTHLVMLLFAQRGHRIGPRRPARGEISRGGDCQDDGISRGYAVKKARHVSCRKSSSPRWGWAGTPESSRCCWCRCPAKW